MDAKTIFDAMGKAKDVVTERAAKGFSTAKEFVGGLRGAGVQPEAAPAASAPTGTPSAQPVRAPMNFGDAVSVEDMKARAAMDAARPAIASQAELGAKAVPPISNAGAAVKAGMAPEAPISNVRPTSVAGVTDNVRPANAWSASAGNAPGAAPTTASPTTSAGYLGGKELATRMRGGAAGAGGLLAAGVQAVSEGEDLGKVMDSPTATGLDKATQLSEAAARVGGAGAGAMAGGAAGGMIGGGLGAVGATVGGLVGMAGGAYLGKEGVDKLIRGARLVLGSDAASPAEKIQAAQALET